MPKVEDALPERGGPDDWVELTGEEVRCLLGLKSYYTILKDQEEQEALTSAWEDLQTEFKRLQQYAWYKIKPEESHDS